MWVGVERDRDVVRGEHEFASLAEDPASFDARWRGCRAFAVREDEHAVPAAAIFGVVGETGGCFEVCAAAADSFDLRVGTFAPFDDVVFCDGVVEGKDGDRDSFGERSEFAEE